MQGKNPWSLERLQTYIGQEETYNLEFKSSRGLLQSTAGELEKTFNDLSTHISAFLNSDGGLLIIGIEEFDKRDKKQAGKAAALSDGIPRSLWIGDRIQSKLCDRIQPAVASYVLVHTVVVGKQEAEDLLAFVIEVKPGITAYQAADKKYYSRRSFSSEPMDDKDVRLRMLSDSVPRVALDVHVEVLPDIGSWERYRSAFQTYADAKQRLRDKRPSGLTPEEILARMQAGAFKFDDNATVMPPKKIDIGRAVFQVIARNTGISSIRRACVQFKLPVALVEGSSIERPDVGLVTEQQLDLSLIELDFSSLGKVMLYPEMTRCVLELSVNFPRGLTTQYFDNSAEIVLYLDGGMPEQVSIDLARMVNEAVAKHEELATQIEHSYPNVVPW